MERMMGAEQVAEIMSVSRRSAYTMMYRMPHMERPLRVSERALKEYIESKTVYPAQRKRG